MKPDHSQDLFGRPLPVHVRQESLQLGDARHAPREGHALASPLPMDPRTVEMALGDAGDPFASLLARRGAASAAGRAEAEDEAERAEAIRRRAPGPDLPHLFARHFSVLGRVIRAGGRLCPGYSTEARDLQAWGYVRSDGNDIVSTTAGLRRYQEYTR